MGELPGLEATARVQAIATGAALLRGFAREDADALVASVAQIAARAPFRHLITPGGHTMSVAMTNCGTVGWFSDRRGYRYTETDPLTLQPWPAMPALFQSVANRAARALGFAGFRPDACLINRYAPGARLSLHQDRDEGDLSQPIVSVSLGLPAIFLFGGQQRGDRTQRYRVESGDVVVFGGASRMIFHGVAPVADGDHPLTGACRINLTFRSALPPSLYEAGAPA